MARESSPVPVDKPGAETVAGTPPADPAPDIAALLQKAKELSPDGIELHTHQKNWKARASTSA